MTNEIRGSLRDEGDKKLYKISVMQYDGTTGSFIISESTMEDALRVGRQMVSRSNDMEDITGIAIF